jgi:D-aminoacyl-tRNA deacylase
MRAVVQRISRARVTVDGSPAAEIAAGLLVFVGVANDDGPGDVEYIATKTRELRIFPDGDGRMNRSVVDSGGAVLVVSQFTLYGDAARGRRPSFIDAARPETAIPLYQQFVAALRDRGLEVATGEFGAAMQVAIHNDGPVTLILDRAP